MFVVQLAITSVIFLGLLISNCLTIVLIALFIFGDEHSNLQGADYYIVSLAISDLILGIVLLPLSLISFSMRQWPFGLDVCELYAYLWFALWLINIYTFLLLSADRRLYVTDKKYCHYTRRTRARCICEIVLAWFIALSLSFVPAFLRSSSLSTILVQHHICTINWHKAVGYFAVVIIATVVPCLLCTSRNFIKIFYWRMKQWKLWTTKRKLSAATVQCLFDPTHAVCSVLFIVFWSSWIPFTVHICGHLTTLQTPSVFSFWLGGSQGIWKFPIMIAICPRYRRYFCNFRCNKASNVATVSSGEVFNVECDLLPRLHQPHSATDDIEENL